MKRIFLGLVTAALLGAQIRYGVVLRDDTPRSVPVDSLGVSDIRLTIDWSKQEPFSGEINTTQDTPIAAAEAAGLRVFPTLAIGRAAWIDGQLPSAQPPRSFPPKDLTAAPDPAFGYSQSYYNFVFRVFTQYRGHFSYAAIENEPNSDQYWGGSPDEYARVLKTAYKAIKAADPNVKVVDGGISSGAWGLVLAQDWINRQVKTPADAYDFALHYYTDDLPLNDQDLRSLADVQTALGGTAAQQQFQTITAILDGIAGTVDALNLHYYQSYRWLPTVSGWLQDRARRAGRDLPVLTNELGIRGEADAGCTETPPFSDTEFVRQAQAVFKGLVAARAAGLNPVEWFSIDTICTTALSPDKISLLNPDNTPRPSGVAFQVATQALGGATLDKILSTGPFLWEYRFNDSSAKPTLVAAWTEMSGAQGLTLPAAGYSQAVVTNYKGKATTYQVTNGQVSVPVTQEPELIRLVGALAVVGNVSAAGYGGNSVAPDSIVAAYGSGLADREEQAATQPLPTTLGGATVTVRDSAGVERLAPLFYASPKQVNYVMPAGTALGAATVTIHGAIGNVQITAVAPGVFSVTGDGKGLAAANVFRVGRNAQGFEPMARFDPVLNQWVAIPVDLGPDTDQVYLILYGTGIRNFITMAALSVRIGGTPATVAFAGPQGGLAGLDQVNVLLPRSLAGRGDLDIVLTVDGLVANTVRVNVR